MVVSILTLEIHRDRDIALARQRARQIAALLGFEAQDQTRIATSVSEITRNALRYGGGGKAEFSLADSPRPQEFVITVQDFGPGIADLDAVLKGQYTSATGMGRGISGSRRLMSSFQIDSTPGKGTVVTMAKALSPLLEPLNGPGLAALADKLLELRPESAYDEIQRQNREVMTTLEELIRLNRELEDTNRGVIVLYAELEEKARQVQKMDALKSRVLSHISHEFRTPLSSILGLSQILLDRIDGDLSDEQQKQVDYIRTAAQILLELVNDLLDIARIEAGEVGINISSFSVIGLFSALRGLMRPLDVNPEVELIINEPSALPYLQTDENKVAQILRNLVSNALKFTERGGIQVSAELDETERKIVFVVCDTGIGIAPQDQERIFEEYSQIASPLQEKTRGTGLGLPLSRKLAELLHGTLTVESELGKGSTFRAAIPVEFNEAPSVEEAAAPARKAAPDGERATKDLTILVVEDNPETIDFYEQAVKDTGFQVIAVRSVDAVRHALKKFKPLAVVLDVVLPGEDGWILLAEITADEHLSRVSVFVVTILEGQRDRAMLLGANDYCVKPVDQNWLLEKLQLLNVREKVLVIDDEDMSRYLLRSRLAGTDYTIIEAESGSDGLRLARAEQPDVIFLDLVMPGMNGFEVLDALKADSTTSDIPVVIQTAKVLSDQERQQLDNGAIAILSKENRSRDEAIAQITKALIKAGFKQPHGRQRGPS